jgi:hypothetical protein
VRLLKSIPEADWSRMGHHTVRGEVTLEALLALYAEHGRKHVGTITTLRRSQGW